MCGGALGVAGENPCQVLAVKRARSAVSVEGGLVADWDDLEDAPGQLQVIDGETTGCQCTLCLIPMNTPENDDTGSSGGSPACPDFEPVAVTDLNATHD